MSCIQNTYRKYIVIIMSICFHISCVEKCFTWFFFLCRRSRLESERALTHKAVVLFQRVIASKICFAFSRSVWKVLRNVFTVTFVRFNAAFLKRSMNLFLKMRQYACHTGVLHYWIPLYSLFWLSECHPCATESQPQSAAVWEWNICPGLLSGAAVSSGDSPRVCMCGWNSQSLTPYTDPDLCPDRPQQTPVWFVSVFM